MKKITATQRFGWSQHAAPNPSKAHPGVIVAQTASIHPAEIGNAPHLWRLCNFYSVTPPFKGAIEHAINNRNRFSSYVNWLETWTGSKRALAKLSSGPNDPYVAPRDELYKDLTLINAEVIDFVSLSQPFLSTIPHSKYAKATIDAALYARSPYVSVEESALFLYMAVADYCQTVVSLQRSFAAVCEFRMGLSPDEHTLTDAIEQTFHHQAEENANCHVVMEHEANAVKTVESFQRQLHVYRLSRLPQYKGLASYVSRPNA